MINIDKEADAIERALAAMLAKAKQAGVKKPIIYFESEGSVHVMDGDHRGWESDSAMDRQRAVVGQRHLKVPFDVGAW